MGEDACQGPPYVVRFAGVCQSGLDGPGNRENPRAGNAETVTAFLEAALPLAP